MENLTTNTLKARRVRWGRGFGFEGFLVIVIFCVVVFIIIYYHLYDYYSSVLLVRYQHSFDNSMRARERQKARKRKREGEAYFSYPPLSPPFHALL